MQIKITNKEINIDNKYNVVYYLKVLRATLISIELKDVSNSISNGVYYYAYTNNNELMFNSIMSYHLKQFLINTILKVQ